MNTLDPLPTADVTGAVLVARLGGQEVAVGVRDVLTVGRHRNSMLRTSHERVSRRHATVRGEPDGWYFVDEDSLNGSYLGDDLVHRLRIDTTIVIRLGDRRNGPILELYVPVRGDGHDDASHHRQR